MKPRESMNLPEGKTCGGCRHWKRCKALIHDLRAENTTCDFAPSRFATKEDKP